MNALEMSRIPTNETNALPSPCFDAPNQRSTHRKLLSLGSCTLSPKNIIPQRLGTKKPLPLTGLLQNIGWEGLRSHRICGPNETFYRSCAHISHACAWFNLKVTTTGRSMRKKIRRRKWDPNRARQWNHIIFQQIFEWEQNDHIVSL